MKKLKEIYEKNFILFDTILAFTASVFLFLIFPKLDIVCSPTSLNSSYELIGVLTGFLGFLIAILAIIFVFRDGEKLNYLKNSQSYKKVFDIYWSAIKWTSIFLIIFFFYTIFNLPLLNDIYRDVLKNFILIFTFILLSIKTWRCLWITREMFLLSVPSN
jgi:hypothetical protein